MKRFLAAFLSIMMIVSVISCGGSVFAAGTHEDAGYYTAVSITEDGEVTDLGFLTQLADMGMTIALELSPDGTGCLDLFGETTDITWEDGYISAEGDTLAYSLEGTQLTLDFSGLMDGEFIIVLEKNEAPAGDPIPASEGLAGSYKLTAMVNEGEEATEDDLGLLESLGLTCMLYLNEDGTGSLVLFGTEMELTWDDSFLYMDGESTPFTLNGNVLSIEDGETSMTFAKVVEGADGGEGGEGAPIGVRSDGGVLAEGDFDDGQYHVAIVGAEAFTDSDGKDAIRVFYEFTNNSEEMTTAWWELNFSAVQDEYDLSTTSASYDEYPPEYWNDSLDVMPGASILCVEEFKCKLTGGELTFTVSDYWSDPLVCTFDPSNLPGRPAEWTPTPVENPEYFIDYPLSAETENLIFTFTDAEVVDYEGNNFVRVYFDVTNKTEEAESALWLTTLTAYQDGVELTDSNYLPSSDSDYAYYEDIEPGDTIQASCVWDLRSGNPVEVTVIDYVAYSDVIAAATISLE